jgi:hypothetical protein
VGPFALSLNWQFLGVTTLAVGVQTFLLGCIAQVLFDYTGRHRRRWGRVFPYTRTVLVAFGLFVAGIALAVPLVATYVANDLALTQGDTVQNHLALTGLAAAVVGAQLFVSTLVLHGTIIATADARPRVPTEE